MEENHRGRRETDNRRRHRCRRSTLRDHLAGPGAERRMGSLAGTMMIVLFRGTDRHGHTTGSRHHQCDVHDDGQACGRTNEMSRTMSGHITCSHALYIRRSRSSVHSCLLRLQQKVLLDSAAQPSPPPRVQALSDPDCTYWTFAVYRPLFADATKRSV